MIFFLSQEISQGLVKKGKPTASQLMESFKLLSINPEGILYEVSSFIDFCFLSTTVYQNFPILVFKDGNMQIGIKSEFQRGMGRLVVYYGNTTDMLITQFTIIISPVNYLSIQIQEVPSVIQPMKQVLFHLLLFLSSDGVLLFDIFFRNNN